MLHLEDARERCGKRTLATHTFKLPCRSCSVRVIPWRQFCWEADRESGWTERSWGQKIDFAIEFASTKFTSTHDYPIHICIYCTAFVIVEKHICLSETLSETD